MKRETLLRILRHCGDPEESHGEHDAALLEYIGDDEITEAFWSTTKWYA